MINDRLSDMITRIRNGYKAGKKSVSMPYTKYLEQVAKVLVDEKYLAAASIEDLKGSHKTLTLKLSYLGNTPAVSTIRRVSKPGVRRYAKTSGLKPVLSGLGISIVTTSSGVMTDRRARKAKLGGEVLFELW